MFLVGAKVRLAPIRVHTIAIVEVAHAAGDFATAQCATRHGVISNARNATTATVGNRIEGRFAAIAVPTVTVAESGVTAHHHACPGGACGCRVGGRAGGAAGSAIRQRRRAGFAAVAEDPIAIPIATHARRQLTGSTRTR